jgi:hypothetical protein
MMGGVDVYWEESALDEGIAKLAALLSYSKECYPSRKWKFVVFVSAEPW